MRAVVAMDCHPAAEQGLELVGGWGNQFASEVLLLTVLDPQKKDCFFDNEGHEQVPAAVGSVYGNVQVSVRQPPPRALQDHGRSLEAATAEAVEYLKSRAEKFLHGREALCFVEWDDNPAHAIVAFAREHQADVVVVGSRNRGAIKQALLGSVAEAVVRGSAVPVLVVREGMGGEP